MINVARVLIGGVTAGAVAWDERKECGVFEFDEPFLKRGWDIAPLTMPLDRAIKGTRTYSFPTLNRETFKGLPGLLADSLPDNFGNALIDAWLARQGKTAASFLPIDRLCYTGKRGMGALEFEPVIPGGAELSNPVVVEELVALAKKVLSHKAVWKGNIHNDADKGLLELIRMGSSAGGARPKAVIAYNESTGDVRSGQVDGLDGYEYWILKFDGVANKALGDPKGYGRIEYAYHLMATEAGITMEPCKLLREHGRAHFMTHRFDRKGTTKIHMQTLCAMAHFDYNLAGAYSYEQAFQVMRQLRMPYGDMEQLYRRMVFNVVARNQDDHTKNISFLMDSAGQWRLAPAYDMTYACNPTNKWLMAHQMSINGKREGINRQDLIAVAKGLNIKKPGVIIDEVLEAVAQWPAFAKEGSVEGGQIKVIRKSLGLKL